MVTAERVGKTHTDTMVRPGNPEVTLEKEYWGAIDKTTAQRTAYVGIHGGRPKQLNMRHDLVRHSEEFNWGYMGSGPAQLALAILADATNNDHVALDLYQEFKRDVVGRWDEYRPFRIRLKTVLMWVQRNQRLAPAES